MQQIVWTLLPKTAELVTVPGVSSGDRIVSDDLPPGDAIRLRFSVLVSPRLAGTTGRLDEFGPFLDWPATLAVTSFGVGFEGGPSFPAFIDPSGPYLARSDVWKGIFGPRTPVTSHVFDDHSGNQLISYPEASTAAMLSATYEATVTATPTVAPASGQWGDPASGLPSTVHDLRNLDRDRGSVMSGLNALLAENGYLPSSAVVTPVQKAAVLEQFLGGPQPGSVSVPSKDLPPTPEFDFHRALSIVGQYPMLQRLMGVVIDCYADVPLSYAGDWTIRFEVAPDPSDADRRPGSRCRIARDRFDAVALDSAYVDQGMLQVGGTRFAPITVDLDGGVLKLVSLAATVAGPTDPTAIEPLAALRSAGISLAMSDRAAMVAADLKRSKKNNDDLQGGLPVTLYAEDLIRGFRPDIFESEPGRWSSLTAQIGTVEIASEFGSAVAGLPPLTGEAIVTTSTTSEDPAGVKQKLPESLFGWTGWSLAVSQPGSVLDNPKTDGSGGGVGNVASGPRPELDVNVAVHPKSGSLPLLRYGSSYRVRVRTVDLAGNGPALEQPSSTPGQTALFKYERFEPVPTPEVLFVAPRTEGETIDRIVIRSQGPDDLNPSVALRHIAPPIMSWAMTETHRRFDRSVGGRVGPDPGAYVTYGTREKGGFGSRTGANPAEVVAHPQAKPDPSASGTFFYDATPLAINYLPDVFSVGACLRGLPGFTTPDWRSFVEDGDGWPDYRAYRLQVQEQSVAVPFHDGSRVLTVALPKAETVEVYLSSFLADGTEDQMGIFGLLSGSAKAALRTNARLGFLWALTPSRTLTLVHAVRVPMTPAEPLGMNRTRGIGDTFAYVIGQLSLHRKSTSRVDVSATWVDCVDDLKPVAGSGVLTAADFEVPRPSTPAFSVDADRVLTPPMTENVLQVGDRHEFGDTKHRVVTYSFNAITRFAEYFTEHQKVTAAGSFAGGQLVDLGGELVPGSTTVRTDDHSRTFSERTAFDVDDVSGKVMLNIGTGVGQIASGTKLVISFLKTPISSMSTAHKELVIPSSARPAPAEVDFVLPTFGWDLGAARRRSGRGLRVYLRRPWFSSGCGEKLGVVLWQNPLPARSVFPNAPQHVTHWAHDPLYAGPALSSDWPTLASIPSKAGSANGLTLPEFAGKVDVAVHEVAFDTERQLWFADLVFDPGSAYNPFIRLALARYQREAFSGYNLSQVTRVDYMQLAPDRVLSLVPASDRVQVMVSGPDGSTVAGPGVAEAWFEVKDASIVDPDLGWSRSGGLISLTRSKIGDSTTWQGLVKYPRGDAKRRLVVQQLEQFPSDSAGFFNLPDRRVVYMDTVEL